MFYPNQIETHQNHFHCQLSRFQGCFFYQTQAIGPVTQEYGFFWFVVGVCSTYVSSCSWLIAGKTSKNCNQRCVLFVRCRFPFCCVINILKGTSFGRDIFQGGGSLVYFPVMSDYSPVMVDD